MSLKNIYLEQHFKQVTAGCLLAFQSCFPFSAKKKKKKKETDINIHVLCRVRESKNGFKLI